LLIVAIIIFLMVTCECLCWWINMGQLDCEVSMMGSDAAYIHTHMPTYMHIYRHEYTNKYG
jgi:hypothetical protein